jgi:hypothetical protein
MAKQPFSLSDDDYASREEHRNISFAKILRIDPVKIDDEGSNSQSDRSSDENSRGIDFSDGEDTAKHEKDIEKMRKGCSTTPRLRPLSETEIAS